MKTALDSGHNEDCTGLGDKMKPAQYGEGGIDAADTSPTSIVAGA
jgi:hypothetical protein